MKPQPLIALICLSLAACSGPDAPPTAPAEPGSPAGDALMSATTGIVAAAAGQLQLLETPLDDGITLDFTYTRLMDTRGNLAGGTIRHVLVEVVDTPVDDAVAVLRASIEAAGYVITDDRHVQDTRLLAFAKGAADINLSAATEGDGRGGVSGRGTGSITLRMTRMPND